MAQQKKQKEAPKQTTCPSHYHRSFPEAPLPVHIPKEVADVSIQTVADAVEENALYEVQHQVEEVSTLLDISIGLPDSKDYDSAFKSDSDFQKAKLLRY